MTNRKKQNNNRNTKHHIIPKSRNGKKTLENICRVPNKEHQNYHNLFINRTPYEILDYLTKTFWNGDTKYVLDYAEDIKKTLY